MEVNMFEIIKQAITKLSDLNEDDVELEVYAILCALKENGYTIVKKGDTK